MDSCKEFKDKKENNNAKGDYQKIRSRYILKEIFNIIKKEKMLEIVKINKKTQRKLDITLKDYIKFSRTYSTIEIEIIPFQKKI